LEAFLNLTSAPEAPRNCKMGVMVPELSPDKSDFCGLRVVAFESRRAGDVETLIRQRNGQPLVAPSMQEIPLGDQTEAFRFGERLLGGTLDALILLTGVGARALFEALSTKHSRDSLIQALSKLTLIARGPKSVQALSEWGLKATLVVPEPNTWREILALLDRPPGIRGLRVAVQEYGSSNPDLIKGLKDRGAQVLVVPVYRWALPDNLEPLRRAVKAVCDRQADVLLFTSGMQIQHVLQVAGMMGMEAGFREGVHHCVIASVGPVCTEELSRQGFSVDIEPVNPHLGSLLQEASRKSALVLKKRTQS